MIVFISKVIGFNTLGFKFESEIKMSVSSRTHYLCEMIVPLLSGLVIGVGGAVLLGWSLDISWLKSISPNFVSMKPNAALSFILAGSGLMLLRHESPVLWKRLLAQIVSVAVIVISVATLIEYIANVDLRIDQWAFHEPLGAVGTSSPGRMSPSSAINFIFIGAALLFLDFRRHYQVVQFLVVLAALFSLLNLAGYLYDAGFYYRLTPYTKMAVHSALTFIALCIGVLCARSSQGLIKVVLGDNLGGVVARRLLPAAVLAPLMLGWFRLTGELRGLFDTKFGIIFMVVGSSLIFILLIWWCANLLYRTDERWHRAEEALRRAHGDLERQVEERTQRLKEVNESLQAEIAVRQEVQKSLKRANDKLLRLNQIKTDFTSMVSHELRTPLSAIKESIQLVMDGVDGPVTKEQQDTLNITFRNVDRLTRLINSVLDFSKMEAGKMELSLASCNIVEVVREVGDLMSLAIQKKGIDFQLELPTESIPLTCDADKVKQVIINLLDNALKFTDPGGTITVRLSKGKAGVRIDVEDTGMGIQEDNYSIIFEMFTQVAREGVKKVKAGAGLGLALCRQIAKLHGGTIEVKSVKGKGSHFYVTLPFLV